MGTIMSGLIHMYCGDGKGKTTAAIGLAVRAAGSGMKVLIVRFLKNNNSSELEILNTLENIDILPIEKEFGFYKNMTEEMKSAAHEMYTNLLNSAIDKVSLGDYQMLVLDEIAAAYHYDFIDVKSFLNFLETKPTELEIVMTGRDPSIKLVELADYVSNIENIRHPYDKGISARTGIEK